MINRLLLYSKNGYHNKQWNLPESLHVYKMLDVYQVITQGRKFLYSIPNNKGTIKISASDSGYQIVPLKK